MNNSPQRLSPVTETVEVSREWLAHIISVLQGELPSGRIGDCVFLLRDQLQDILDRPAGLAQTSEVLLRCAACGTLNSFEPSDAAKNPAVPDGYVLLPRKLTAENGAKAALIGELYETTTVTDENGDDRPFKVPVSWDTIKRIWDTTVLHFAVSDTSTDRTGK